MGQDTGPGQLLCWVEGGQEGLQARGQAGHEEHQGDGHLHVGLAEVFCVKTREMAVWMRVAAEQTKYDLIFW